MFEYIEKENEIVLTSYIGKQKKVIVPETINGKKVTEINSLCFFDNNNITEIQFPNLINVEDGAIVGCENLKRIYFKNVKYINKFYEDCEKIKIYLTEKNIFENDKYDSITIKLYNFTYFQEDNYIVLKDLKTYGEVNKWLILPNYIEGKKVKKIAKNFFLPLKGIVGSLLPNSFTIVWNDFIDTIPNEFLYNVINIDELKNVKAIKKVGKLAFYRCPLAINETLYLEEIGEEAFTNCLKINKINTKNIKKIEEKSFFKSSFKKVDLSNYKGILPKALFAVSNIEQVILPKNTSFIPEEFFSICTNLKVIKNIDKITKISQKGFYKCNNLKFDECFFNQLTYVGTESMNGIIGPKKLTLGNVRISVGSFEGLKNTQEIEFTNDFKQVEIPERCFCTTYSLRKVILSKNIKVLKEQCFVDTTLEDINLENITIFKKQCLRYSNLKEAKLDNAKFTKECFEIPFEFSKIKKIDLSKNKSTIIPEKAFKNCHELKEIIMNDNIEEIKDEAFLETSLSNFNFPKNTKIIGKNVIKSNKLKKIFIPKSLNTMSSFSFANLECTINFEDNYKIDEKLISQRPFASFLGILNTKNCIIENNEKVKNYINNKEYLNIFSLDSPLPGWHIKYEYKK